MKKSKWLIFLLLFNSPLSFSVTTGGELYNWCDDDSMALICFGYIMGANEQQEMNFFMSESIGYCVGTRTYGDKRRVIIEYAENHPEELTFPAFQLVRNAFSDSYPCSSSQLQKFFEAIDQLNNQEIAP